MCFVFPPHFLSNQTGFKLIELHFISYQYRRKVRRGPGREAVQEVTIRSRSWTRDPVFGPKVGIAIVDWTGFAVLLDEVVERHVQRALHFLWEKLWSDSAMEEGFASFSEEQSRVFTQVLKWRVLALLWRRRRKKKKKGILDVSLPSSISKNDTRCCFQKRIACCRCSLTLSFFSYSKLGIQLLSIIWHFHAWTNF